MRIAIGVAATVLVADQASKWAVVDVMGLDQRLFIPVFDPFLNFAMAWNTGINFGLFSSGSGAARAVLVALALAICAWVWVWVRRDGARKWMQVAAGFLIGGALGNVIDRLRWGAVADFINMSCCGLQNPYSFNIADIAVFAGAFGLILFSGRGEKHKDAG
ncbi:signal peptidase II [Roseinatronobacter alkalisoli]|uniref:Lipoprotein signal peptidase n=1 Tax=Roseinatronobacter alkalisoli TaxID=3028235 RepID=A0ABT5TBE1_9RHOB|nr:signal peptidase II [Roseinatronobacter sp. HJB301]MDD7972449.1 signal peptidase II [Roseinatronobacter sp. HJB301]